MKLRPHRPNLAGAVDFFCNDEYVGLSHATSEGVPVATVVQNGERAPIEGNMLWTIFVILLVLWLLGLVTSYTLGGFIHILLVVAIAVLLIEVISGRRAV